MSFRQIPVIGVGGSLRAVFSKMPFQGRQQKLSDRMSWEISLCLVVACFTHSSAVSHLPSPPTFALFPSCSPPTLHLFFTHYPPIFGTIDTTFPTCENLKIMGLTGIGKCWTDKAEEAHHRQVPLGVRGQLFGSSEGIHSRRCIGCVHFRLQPGSGRRDKQFPWNRGGDAAWTLECGAKNTQKIFKKPTSSVQCKFKGPGKTKIC